MEGLLSYIIFAGLFYLMMRYGCGAHMFHGGRHGSHSEPNESKHTDPVCGMEVDVDKGYGKMHESTLYRFCSRDCLDKFEDNTDKYLNPKNEEGGAP